MALLNWLSNKEADWTVNRSFEFVHAKCYAQSLDFNVTKIVQSEKRILQVSPKLCMA